MRQRHFFLNLLLGDRQPQNDRQSNSISPLERFFIGSLSEGQILVMFSTIHPFAGAWSEILKVNALEEKLERQKGGICTPQKILKFTASKIPFRKKIRRICCEGARKGTYFVFHPNTV